MTEEREAYYETQQERQSIARSVRANAPRRSIGSRCGLGSDHLSRKELEAMNGECHTLELNRFYTWDEFKELPLSLQIQYITHMVDRYNCSIGILSTDLFGLSNATVYKHFNSRGVASEQLADMQKNAAYGYSNKAKAGRARLKEDIAIARANEEAEETVPDHYLVWDPASGSYFESDKKTLQLAEAKLNSLYAVRDVVTLNDAYEIFGLTKCETGDAFGWDHKFFGDISFHQTQMDNGVWVIGFDPEPVHLFDPAYPVITTDESVVLKPEDISFRDESEPPAMPRYDCPFTHMDFRMDRFDLDMLGNIQKLFDGKKVQLDIRITVQE